MSVAMQLPQQISVLTPIPCVACAGGDFHGAQDAVGTASLAHSGGAYVAD